MCGIVAILQPNKAAQGIPLNIADSIFSQMLFADTLRGFDSTGIIGASEDDLVSYKRALSAYDFLNLRQSKKIMEDSFLFNFLIGHNRAATKGKVNDEGAHPFEFDNVIGVHNGTLVTHAALNPGQTFSIDSEAIYAAIDRDGVDDTIEQLNGAFALVWFDKVDKTIKAVRNNERPLAIITLKNSDTVILASEPKMAEWIVHRQLRTSVAVDKVQYIPPGKLYTFNTDNPSDWNIRDVKLRPEMQHYFPHYNKSYPQKPKHDPKIIHIGDLTVDKDIEMFVSDVDIVNKDLIKVTGYCDSEQIPLVQCYIMENNQAKIDIHAIEAGHSITGPIKNIKNKDNLLLVTMVAINHFVYETVPEEGEEEPTIVPLLGPSGKEITLDVWERFTKGGCAICSCDLSPGNEILWTNSAQPICNEHDAEQLNDFGVTIN